MSFPTIFDWLETFAPVRGYPAVYIVIACATLVVLFLDWRLSLMALAVQYFVGGLLFVDLLDPRLAIIKILSGLFVCLILYFTARQIDYGHLPSDLTDVERRRIKARNSVELGRWQVPALLLRRLGAVIVALVLTIAATALFDFRLPGVSEGLDYLNLAMVGLMALGLAGVLTGGDPLPLGMAFFTFLTGFELFFHVFDQTVTALLGFAALQLVAALVISYLAQMRRASFYNHING